MAIFLALFPLRRQNNGIVSGSYVLLLETVRRSKINDGTKIAQVGFRFFPVFAT